ncbi:MAG: MFS transporter [Thiohalomonadales bacterium]
MYSPNRPFTLISAIWINSIATLWYFLLPLYTGTLLNQLHFSLNQISWLASVELLGYALASASAFFWVRRCSWFRLIITATLVIFVVNVFCLFWHLFDVLIILRFISGMAGGVLLAITYSLLADTKNPERNFSFVIAAQIFLAVIILLSLPSLINELGVNGFFLAIGILTISILPLVRYFPNKQVNHKNKTVYFSSFSLPAIRILVAVAIYMIGQTAVWTYAERLGATANLEQDFINFTIAITLAISIIGGLFAAWLANRRGYVLPFMFVIVLQGFVLWLLINPNTQFQFFIAIGIFQLIWTFITPYFISVLVKVDNSGRYVSLIVFASAMGAVFGPALAGQFISEQNYIPALVICAVCTVLSIVIIAPELGKNSIDLIGDTDNLTI